MVSSLRDLITFPATYPGLKPGATICAVPTEQDFVVTNYDSYCMAGHLVLSRRDNMSIENKRIYNLTP